MQVIQSAILVDQAISEAMRTRIERTICPQCAGVHQSVAGRVRCLKLHPAFIKVALLRYKAVSDAFVLNHNGDGQHVACGNFKGLTAKRCDNLVSVAFNSKDVHIENSVAQKGKCLFHLRIVAVIL